MFSVKAFFIVSIIFGMIKEQNRSWPARRHHMIMGLTAKVLNSNFDERISECNIVAPKNDKIP